MYAINKKVPYQVYSTYTGYKSLIHIYHDLKDLADTDISIDFTNCKWFEANLTAILAAIIQSLEKKENRVHLINLKPKIKEIFQRNRFLSQFGHPVITDANKTIVTFKKFHPRDERNFIDYIRNELLQKKDFPRLSRMAAKKINESIFELFENARTHGLCEFIYSCGQYYPQQNPPRIDFTIVDMGKTIKANVNEFLKRDMAGVQTIQWAIGYGHTTKTGKISGGLGLDLILEFIKLNKGKFQIVSSDGFWEYSKGKITKKSFNKFFPGTIANLEFNLDDRDYYQLKEEISQDNIF